VASSGKSAWVQWDAAAASSFIFSHNLEAIQFSNWVLEVTVTLGLKGERGGLFGGLKLLLKHRVFVRVKKRERERERERERVGWWPN
jgi:hypothetical protein